MNNLIEKKINNFIEDWTPVKGNQLIIDFYDLLEAAGVHDIEEVEYAFINSNGDIVFEICKYRIKELYDKHQLEQKGEVSYD